MVEYNKVNCQLSNVQINQLKKAVKSKEGASLRLGIKNFNKDELPHELLLTTRQNTKLRNAINNNLATDIKLSQAQIKKLDKNTETNTPRQKILGWCPAGSVLPHGEKVPL